MAGAAVAVAGLGYSMYSGERQQKASESYYSKERARQSRLETEEKNRYRSEIQRQMEYAGKQEALMAGQFASAKQDYEEYSQTTARQYESEMQDYESQVENLEEWKAHWTSIAEDPAGGHPGWPSFESAISEAAESQMEQIEDTYQRRGKAGSGEYMRAISEVEGTRQKSLQDALMGITREARGKMYEIDAAMPSRPTLPMPMQRPVLGGVQNLQAGMGQLGVGQSPLGDPTRATGDMAGLGEGLAYALDKYGKKDKDDGRYDFMSTLSGTEAGVESSTEWTIPGAGGVYESAFGEELAPQQTEYQLLQ